SRLSEPSPPNTLGGRGIWPLAGPASSAQARAAIRWPSPRRAYQWLLRVITSCTREICLVPLDPTISLQAGGGAAPGGSQTPAQTIDTWSQAVNRINQNQL